MVFTLGNNKSGTAQAKLGDEAFLVFSISPQ